MKQKKIKIANGLNKLIYDSDEDPVDGVKLPFEQLAVLCREGEILGVELSKQMMGYGFDFYGTFVRTYALSQMVAYLKVFAMDKGFDAMAMFDILTPKFTKEAEEMLEEIKAEQHEQQKCGYMFLDLNTEVGAKEFKKILKNIESE